MAIDVKMDFLREAEKALADKVTAAQMPVIMNALSDVLQEYEMRSVSVWDDRKDDLLDCYLGALSVQCRSDKTIARYKYELERMMHGVGVPTRQITVYHLRNYLAAEKARGVSDSTLEGLRQVYSAFFNWLQRESLIEKNPTANLGTIKRAKKVKKTYSEIDIAKLMNMCRTVRDKAIIQFLYSTGCRISEMTGLDRDAVDLERLECMVHGKGNKERTVFLSPVSGMWLEQYLKERTDTEPALFIGKRHERLQPEGVRYMLKVLAKDAGVDHVHPHKFRRTRATELASHGMPIQEIAALLGHEKIDTTMKYVMTNSESIRNSVRRCS